MKLLIIRWYRPLGMQAFQKLLSLVYDSEVMNKIEGKSTSAALAGLYSNTGCTVLVINTMECAESAIVNIYICLIIYVND